MWCRLECSRNSACFLKFRLFRPQNIGPRFFRKALPTHLCHGYETRRQIVGWSGLTAGREDWIVRTSTRVHLSTTRPHSSLLSRCSEFFCEVFYTVFWGFFQSYRGSITNDDIRDDRPLSCRFTRHSYFTCMPHVSHTCPLTLNSCRQIHCSVQCPNPKSSYRS
jgi:hypothetical protein